MTQRLGIIGHPIGHSISPVFQQAALDHLAIDGVYEKWDVVPEGVGAFLDGLRAPGTLGINVTVPHKEAVVPFLDEVDDWASAAGAVNTIVNRQGRLTGHNTDGIGFLRALRDGARVRPDGQAGADSGGRRRGAGGCAGLGQGRGWVDGDRQPYRGAGWAFGWAVREQRRVRVGVFTDRRCRGR